MKKKEQPVTYKEVGESIGLKEGKLQMFTEYMRARFPDETNIVKNGYAVKWAEHFKKGREFLEADDEGQTMLMTLTEVYYAHKFGSGNKKEGAE